MERIIGLAAHLFRGHAHARFNEFNCLTKRVGEWPITERQINEISISTGISVDALFYSIRDFFSQLKFLKKLLKMI